MEFLTTIQQWLATHPTSGPLVAIAAVLFKEHAIVCGLLIPFVWPPLRWLLRQYAKLTPWADDDKLADELDSKVQDIVDNRLGMPKSDK